MRPLKEVLKEIEKIDAEYDKAFQLPTIEQYMKSNNPNKFKYMMLSRLQMDCEYYLGMGGRSDKCLWAGNVTDHIAEMKRIYGELPTKPEWLTDQDIAEYERKMCDSVALVNANKYE